VVRRGSPQDGGGYRVVERGLIAARLRGSEPL